LAQVLRASLNVPDDEEGGREHVHGFHSYPARLHPQIARVLVREFCPRGAVVLDPFCGSGTTLVEARLAGRRAWGVDANPLAVLLTERKCSDRAPSSWTALLAEAEKVAAVAEDRRRIRKGASRKYPEEDVIAFAPHVLLELDGLRVGLERLAASTVRQDLELVLSSLLTKLSRQTGDAAEALLEKRIASGYPTRLFVRKTQEYVQRLQMFQRLLPTPPPPAPVVVEGDARFLDQLVMPPVNLVVTSPPYPGNYDYLAHHERRLRWLHLETAALNHREIGARRRLDSLPFSDALGQWEKDLRSCLQQLKRVVIEGGKIVFVIADSIMAKRAVNNRRTIENAARAVGLHVLAGVSQTRPSRYLPSPQAFHRTPRYEHIILMEKGE